MGSIGVEKMLSEITESAKDANKEGSTSTEEAKENEDEQDVFSEGWQEYADARYKVTVFSKVSSSFFILARKPSLTLVVLPILEASQGDLAKISTHPVSLHCRARPAA